MSKLRKWMMKEERDTNSCGSGDLSSSAIKLFGKTIAVSTSADSACVSVTTKAGSEEVDGASTQLEGENLGSSLGSICNETGTKEGEVVNGDSAIPEVVNASLAVVESSPSQQPESNPTSSLTQQQPENCSTPQRALTQEERKEQCSKKPDKLIPCPRCDSVDTKFCYYNNYNINQPRHFLQELSAVLDGGGTLRNVLVGAGRRKNKYGVGSKQDGENNNNSTAVRMDHHEPAQQPSFSPAVMNAYTLGTVPPMNLPRHGQSPRNHTVVGSDSSTVTTMGMASAFKPLGSEVSSDSVSKLRQRTQPEVVSKGDCASSGDTSTPTYVLTPRAAPETQQAVWTKSGAGAPLGFYNGAWPYGYNIGWSGAGSIPPGPPSVCATAHSASLGLGTPSPVWTGMWASAAPVPTFGWNVLQGGWTLPWRPVPAVGVQMQQSQGQGVSNTTTTTTPRKREGASISEGERGKIARVGSGEEVVAV